MPLSLQAIIPKTYAPFDPAAVNAQLIKANTAFLQALQRKLMAYPPQQPTDYKRTGDYGKGWAGPGSVTVSATEAILVNKIAYAVYVGGPLPGAGAGHRQAAVMTKKGWPSVTNVAKSEIGKYPQVISVAITGQPG